MKTFKRFSAIILTVLLMVAMMAVPASAAGEGRIQINNTAVNTTYKLYKIFDIEAVGGSYFYKPTTAWKPFFTKATSGTSPNGTLYGTVAANGYIVWLNQSLFVDGDIGKIAGAAFAKHAQEYAASKNADVTIASTSNSLTITGLDQNAYYLVVSSLGGTVMAGPIKNEDFVINEKNDVGLAPTIVKTVGDNKEYMSVDMGQAFPFKIVATLNEAIPNGTTVTITDVVPQHIKIDKTSVVVKNGDTTLTEGEGNDYIFKHEDGTDTFIHTFTFTSGFNAGDVLTITYNGTLVPVGTTLPVSHEMYTNRATLSYESKSVFDTAAVFTLAVNGYKYFISDTGVETDLDDAQFVLQCNYGPNIGKYYKLTDGVVSWDTLDKATTKTSDINGEFTFLGIAMGDYTLVETVPPSGYTGAGEISLTVNRDLGEVRVENVKGTTGLLPETGGIGTPIFYGIGGVLVLGALSLLMVRKRSTAK